MNKHLPQLLILAKNLPPEPGVYLMKNYKNQIIYVGKAKNLPKRVKTYFQVKYPKTLKTSKMVQEVRTFEHILVTSEKEALLLEYNLIKKHQPKYNIKLKNTQGYPYLKLDLTHTYPKLEVSYKVSKNKKVLFFGPYPNVKQLYEIKEFLSKNLQLRTCSDNEIKNRVRPCLLYQIKQCSGPCVYKEVNYQKQIDKLISILKGEKAIIKALTEEMNSFAQEEKFEEAAQIRDLINFCNQQQSVVSQVKKDTKRYCSYVEHQNSILVGVLDINEGKVENLHKITLENFENEPVEDFISQNLLNILPDDKIKTIEASFEFNKELVDVYTQDLGLKFNVNKNKNYEQLIQDNLILEDKYSFEQLEQIKEELKLTKTPFKIECIDISNWQESNPVGSKVVMMEGVLDKSEYRKYKMKTKGPNDFAMIKELVLRRFSKPEDSFPDLLVVDGGSEQLVKALEALNELKIQGVEVVGLAKDKVKNSNFTQSEIISKGERIVKPDGQIILLNSKMSAFILTKLRDEAHRFAINFHRKLRSKNFLMNKNQGD